SQSDAARSAARAAASEEVDCAQPGRADDAQAAAAHLPHASRTFAGRVPARPAAARPADRDQAISAELARSGAEEADRAKSRPYPDGDPLSAGLASCRHPERSAARAVERQCRARNPEADRSVLGFLAAPRRGGADAVVARAQSRPRLSTVRRSR